jgi:prolyl-tRNA editing enzyme YbaK/EbsC (Cys-tRNA(Pro) deacylase)
LIALTGMQVGGVTPFSLPAGVPLYIDDRIMALDWIILGGGGRSLKIKTSPEVFRKLGAESCRGWQCRRKAFGEVNPDYSCRADPKNHQ